MTSILSAGLVLGTLAGLAHAVAVYRGYLSHPPAALAARPGALRARATYYALWTLLLWILFGTYVLVLWLVALAARTAQAAIARLRPARPAVADR